MENKRTKNKTKTRLRVDKTKTRIFAEYYYDQVFVCVDCGNDAIWTAKHQQWWYEVHQAHESSTAKRCQRCREQIRAIKEEQKLHMEEMAIKQPHPYEAFFNKRNRD